MADLLTDRDGEREFQPQNRKPLHAGILESFLTLSRRVWEGIRWLAAFIVIWLVMLRLPLIYEARLARLERSSGEQLALGQTQAEWSARASMQPLDELDPSGIQKGHSLVKRCVLESTLSPSGMLSRSPYFPLLTQVAV